ncbi:MAG: tetratricopeptide repeat protein, partial [Candidatus Cloacimonetes bacterium]|nr:tetratricopeptide repeat protein [Candidatus Cloacimonadota bacterium]
ALDTAAEESVNKAEHFFTLLYDSGDNFNSSRGLFYRGWVYFLSGNFDKSITDFAKLVSEFGKFDSGREKVFFEADAIDNIAYGLNEYDGTDFNSKSKAAEMLITVFAPMLPVDYSKQVLNKLINIKKENSAPMQAVDIYNAYIELYPDSKEIPTYIDSITTIYRRYPNRLREGNDLENSVITEMLRLRNNYNINSKWYSKNKTDNISNELNIIRNALETIEPRHYNAFISQPNFENYIEYLKTVDYFIEFNEFDDEEGLVKKNQFKQRKADITYNFAESNNDISAYLHAYNLYKNINLDIENDSWANNEVNKYFSAEQAFLALSDTLLVFPYEDRINQSTISTNQIEQTFIEASNNYQAYLESLPVLQRDNLVRTVQLRTELLHSKGQSLDALNDLNILLTRDITNEQRKNTLTRVAEINFEIGSYSEAETKFREAQNLASPQEKAQYSNNIWATIKRNAEISKESGNYLIAAEEYIRLANEMPDKDQANSSILEAIKMYEEAGDYDKVYQLYERIAEGETNKEMVLNAYYLAWSLAEKVNDSDNSILLREKFINRFPNSNEAYRTKLQIISSYENGQNKDLSKASALLEELYRNHNKIDLGEDKPEDLFINLIRINTEIGDEEKLISNMLEFERTFPNHPQANDFLIIVAQKYEDRGNTAELEKLAKYLHKKDPSINILSRLAVAKVRELNEQISTSFQEKQYSEMRELIKRMRTLDNDYRKSNLVLPLEDLYAEYEYYEDYINYYENLDKSISLVEDNFLNTSADELVRVNNLTKWKEHLVDGKNRILELQKRAGRETEKLTELIKEGDDYDLDIEKRTHLIYLIAKIHDYSADVIYQQLMKFIRISNQVNKDLKDYPEQQKTIKEGLAQQAKQFELNSRKESIGYYNLLYSNFYLNLNLENEWTIFSYNRLVELQLIPEIYKDIISFDNSWKINDIELFDDNELKKDSEFVWKNVNLTGLVLKDSEELEDFFEIPDNSFEHYLKKEFEIEILPESFLIEYLYIEPVPLYVNDKLLSELPAGKRAESFDDTEYTRFVLRGPDSLYTGINNLSFKFPASSDSLLNRIFKANLILVYDKSDYDSFANSVKKTIVSDDSWNARINSIVDSVSVENDAIISYIDKPSDIPQLFTNEEIYLINVDNRTSPENSQSIVYEKSFTVENSIVLANLYFYSKDSAVLYINETKVAELLPNELVELDVSNYIINNDNIIRINIGESILTQLNGFLLKLDYREKRE